MNSKPINKLLPTEALEQAIKASNLLLKELTSFNKLEEEDPQPSKIDELTQVRDQLVKQVFAHSWSESDVANSHNELEVLEDLNTKLLENASIVRGELHQKRVDNQQGRKALNAYGTAKNQFHR